MRQLMTQRSITKCSTQFMSNSQLIEIPNIKNNIKSFNFTKQLIQSESDSEQSINNSGLITNTLAFSKRKTINFTTMNDFQISDSNSSCSIDDIQQITLDLREKEIQTLQTKTSKLQILLSQQGDQIREFQEQIDRIEQTSIIFDKKVLQLSKKNRRQKREARKVMISNLLLTRTFDQVE